MIVLKLRTFWWKKDNNSKIGFTSNLCVWRFDPSIHFFFYLQFWNKSDYPSWSSCPFFIKFIKKKILFVIFGREPSKDYFIKILFLLSKWFQTKRFLWEFPIGSYVKLSSAVVAILVNCKNLQHVKIFLPCNFEVNPNTHFGVIALFSSKCSQF
jgi:hypothetical protein